MTIQAIVHSSHPVTLVGGSRIDSRDIEVSLSIAPSLVAADGGADNLLENGHAPLAVIGDMDSISHKARIAFEKVLHPVPEQDTTDLQKCLDRIVAPAVLALGFLGGRLDHTFAALNILSQRSEKVLLLGNADVLCFLPQGRIGLDLPIGTRLSLLPMAPAKIWSQGLRWDLTGQDMTPAGFISTSNEVAGPVTLQAEGSVALVVPRGELLPVWSALTSV